MAIANMHGQFPKFGRAVPEICMQRIHTQPFYSSLDRVWDNLGKLLPEGTFRHLLDFLVQNEDNTGRCTNNPDGLPPHPVICVQTNRQTCSSQYFSLLSGT